jgi:hypothetical protein
MIKEKDALKIIITSVLLLSLLAVILDNSASARGGVGIQSPVLDRGPSAGRSLIT